MTNLIRAIIIVFLTCVTMGNKATGQIGSPGLVYQGAFNNAMFLTTKRAIEHGMKSSPRRKTINKVSSTRTTSNLNFVASAKVDAKVLELIGIIAANGNKTKARRATEIIKGQNFLGRFEGILRPYGFSRYNVPDVFTAFIILSWQAISGDDVGNYPDGIELFRKQIHSSLDNNAKLSGFSNDQKQEIAEILSYMAIFFTYASQQQSQKGDTASLATTRQNIRQAVIRVSGIDLAKYTFNNKGLIEK